MRLSGSGAQQSVAERVPQHQQQWQRLQQNHRQLCLHASAVHRLRILACGKTNCQQLVKAWRDSSKSLTVEHVNTNVGNDGVGWRTRILARVGFVCVLDEQVGDGEVALPWLDGYSAAQSVVVYHLQADKESVQHISSVELSVERDGWIVAIFHPGSRMRRQAPLSST